MCGKFNVTVEDGTRQDVFPGGSCKIVAYENGAPQRVERVWGLERRDGAGLIFNARAETVAEKPVFAQNFFERRAVVPVNRFSEWSARDAAGKKHEFFFESPDRPLYLAGFCSRFRPFRFVVLTTAATDSAAIHSRFPLVLTDQDYLEYLADPNFAALFLQTLPRTLACRKAT